MKNDYKKIMPVIRSHIDAMSTYKPPLDGRSSKDYLRLDFNERTIPLPQILIDSLNTYVKRNHLHLYPEYGDVAKLVADYAGVSEEQVIITNGSDQGIDIVYRTFVDHGDEVVVPVPTFAMQLHAAQLQDAHISSPGYSVEFGLTVDSVLEHVTERTKLVAICNPNSPTGYLMSVEEIEAIAEAAPHAVIFVDECYFEFSRSTVKDSITRFPNIVVSRTFSKTWGLAGLRLGYLIADERYIDGFLKVRGPYDMNRVAIEAVRVALKHKQYMESFVEEVMERAKPKLEEYLRGKRIPFWPSRANFLLVVPPDLQKLVGGLLAKDILTRPRGGHGIDNTLRISIGTVEQIDRLIAALDEVLAT